MKPSRINYLFAHTIAIATFSGAAMLTLAVSVECVPAVTKGTFPITLIFAILASMPLGLILGYFIIGYPLFFIGKQLNGAPFQEGDWVRILVGPYRERVVRVTKVWKERNQVCVDIGDDFNKQHNNHVFFILQVCRDTEV